MSSVPLFGFPLTVNNSIFFPSKLVSSLNSLMHPCLGSTIKLTKPPGKANFPAKGVFSSCYK